jgi:hypothetical protein
MRFNWAKLQNLNDFAKNLFGPAIGTAFIISDKATFFIIFSFDEMRIKVAFDLAINKITKVHFFIQ